MEYEEALGLNLYEMSFRSYDPAICVFNGIDPVVHFSQGTSVAFDNNPIVFADPSGADSIDGEMLGADGLTNSQWMDLSKPGGGGFDAMRDQARANSAYLAQQESNVSVTTGELTEGCDDCSLCPDKCTKDNNTNFGAIKLGVNTINSFILPGIKQSAVVTTIPIYNEGKLVAQFSSYSKVPFKVLKILKGALKPLGPIGHGVTTYVSTKQAINGEMSRGRYAFNMLGTGSSIYAGFAFGGPAGILVGGVFYAGNVIYKDIERANEALKKLNPNRANAKWYEFGKMMNYIKTDISITMPTGGRWLPH